MEIEFIPKKKNYEFILEAYPPVKSIQDLPQWFKDIPMGTVENNDLTARKCPAIKDLISTGFIIPLWSRLRLKSRYDENGQYIGQEWDFAAAEATNEDISHHMGTHTYEQHQGMRIGRTANKLILKIQLPYYIKVPKGYNIMYTDPFYHFRQDIRCMSGIVEADKWGYITFPFELINQDFVMEPGVPLVHCFVYKRDDNDLILNHRNGTDKEYKDIDKKWRTNFLNSDDYRTSINIFEEE